MKPKLIGHRYLRVIHNPDFNPQRPDGNTKRSGNPDDNGPKPGVKRRPKKTLKLVSG